MKYYLKNFKQSLKNGKICFSIFLCLLLPTVTVFANATKYEQKDCKGITFQNRFIGNFQSTTSRNLGFNFENSMCLRPELFKTKEKNISVESEQQNIFSFQSRTITGVSETEEKFDFANAISENDFSNQKSYIK